MTTTEYLQREIRRVELSVRRAERKSNTPPEELRGLHEKLEHLQEAMEAVNEHWQRVHEQRGWTAGEPLTVEQLKAINTMTPIWVEKSEQGPGEQYDHWCLCAGGYIITTGLALVQADKMDGVTFYAYPPAHIDREKWTAEWIYPENEFSLPRCSKCGCNSKDAQYGHKDNFCPKCGRAMTPEAWAEMENRLMG